MKSPKIVLEFFPHVVFEWEATYFQLRSFYLQFRYAVETLKEVTLRSLVQFCEALKGCSSVNLSWPALIYRSHGLGILPFKSELAAFTYKHLRILLLTWDSRQKTISFLPWPIAVANDKGRKKTNTENLELTGNEEIYHHEIFLFSFSVVGH